MQQRYFSAPQGGYYRELLTFRAYARSRGLNVSTISRQVARGQIPTVRHGRRLIDPEEADRARARNLDPLSLWGGSASRTRSGADAPCREEHGYAPGVMPLLVGLRADGPGFVRRLMLKAGASEAEAYVGVWVIREVIEAFAHGAFDDPDLVMDHREDVGEFGEPPWPEMPELGEVAERCGRTMEELWELSSQGSALCRELMDAAGRAKG